MWAFRRRLIIVFVLLLIVAAIIGGAILIKRAGERPLCTDNKQNGSETGIDCGGVCARVCSADTVPLFTNWSRVVPVTDTVYSTIVQVENRNYDAIAQRVKYTCNIMTDDFRSVQKVSDTVSVPPAGKYDYVITGLKFSSADVRPTRIECVFDSKHEWLRLPKKTTPTPFDFQGVELITGERPRLLATITNTDNLRTFKSVIVAAVIYDSLDTAIAASTTIVENLQPTLTKNLVFTWPAQFGGVPPYRAELTPSFEFPEHISLPK